MLSISTIAAISYSDFFKSNMSVLSANVINSFENISDNSHYNSSKLFTNVLSVSREKEEKISIDKGPLMLNFNLSNNANRGFAFSGENNAEIMQIKIKSPEAKLVIKSLKFKIVGVDPSMVKNAYLIDQNKKITSATFNNDYLKFSNIMAESEVSEPILLSLRLDLAKELKSSDRIRLDIEQSEDINLIANGDSYELKQQYPIRGRYLSIIKRAAIIEK